MKNVNDRCVYNKSGILSLGQLYYKDVIVNVTVISNSADVSFSAYYSAVWGTDLFLTFLSRIWLINR